MEQQHAAEAVVPRGHERGKRLRLINELARKLEEARITTGATIHAGPGEPKPREAVEIDIAAMTDRTVGIERRCAEKIADLAPSEYIRRQVLYIEQEYGHQGSAIPSSKFFAALCQDWGGWIGQYCRAAAKREKEQTRRARHAHEQAAREQLAAAAAEHAKAQLAPLLQLRPSELRRVIERAIERQPEARQPLLRRMLTIGPDWLKSPALRELAFDELTTHGVPTFGAPRLAAAV